MKALVFDGQLKLAVDFPMPEPGPGEARIRTMLAGLCRTDLEIVKGYAGFQGVLGHEFVGVVDRADQDGVALVGQRVVGEINAGCGTCPTCQSGQPEHCERRTALGIRSRHGALAEYFCLPAASLHPVPESVRDEAAVFAEPLAAACEVPDQAHIRPRYRVIVLGDGKLGLLVAQVVALTGCELTVIGRHADKLGILAARGIDTQLADDGQQVPAGTADVVVDCTGTASGWQTARRLIRPRGTIVLKSTYHGPIQTDLSSLVVNEVRVVGSRCGPMAAALRLLVQGMVDVKPLIQAEYPLDQAVAAFEHAARPGSLKVLVQAGSC